MKVGLVGKPNAGKSTFFSAATAADAQIGDYPFTTIDSNVGVAHVRRECPCGSLGVECEPHNSPCLGGTRYLPVEMVDVAGLVPGAHEGRGMGNQFLDDLRQADVLIQIVDASGQTDLDLPDDSGSTELASMSRTVQVFRDNAVERAELAASQDQENRRREERVARLDTLIGRFEGTVSAALDSLDRANGELRQTSQSMEQSADDVANQSGEAAEAVRTAAEGPGWARSV